MPYQNSGESEDIFAAILLDIQRHKKRTKEVLEYHWFYHSVLDHQRARIFDDLKSSLAKNVKEFSFNGWTRIVSYKFANQPLSA